MSRKKPNDLRPAKWTEALALDFIVSQDYDYDPADLITFAHMFNEGAWPEIQSEFPEFAEFVAKR